MRRLLSLAFLALSACPAPSPGNDGGTDSGVQVSPVEMCDRLASARCALLARCYPAFARETSEDCKTNEQQRCTNQYDALRASFDNGTVSVDGDQLASCETRMSTSSCPATFPPGYPNVAVHPFADCEVMTGLVKGTVASGQTCATAVDCAPGLFCYKANGTCAGICESFASAGDPCGFGCAQGLYCDDKGTTDTSDDRCAPAKGLNKSCNASPECSAELWCNGGVCRPRGKLAEPCVFDPDRLSTCDPGLACDVMPFVQNQVGTCVLPKHEGEPCRFHWTCAAGLVCWDLDYSNFPQSAPPNPGTCNPPTPAQVPCSFTPYSTFVGDQCSSGTACAKAARTCAPLPGLGDSCTPSSQACAGVDVYCKPSGSGDVGTCAGPAQVADKCAFQLDARTQVTVPCVPGAYCDSQFLTCQAANKQEGALCKVDEECVSDRCVTREDLSRRCAKACQ